jgi:mono/diheme cytochrome c family protein
MKKTLILALIALTGCYYDSEEELYPDNGCDTTNVTFSATVFPIIQNNCLSCHGSNPPQGGVYLGNYTSISAAAQIPAGQSGSLYGAITHNSSNYAMPKGAPMLSDCKISQIKAWIDNGTPNN